MPTVTTIRKTLLAVWRLCVCADYKSTHWAVSRFCQVASAEWITDKRRLWIPALECYLGGAHVSFCTEESRQVCVRVCVCVREAKKMKRIMKKCREEMQRQADTPPFACFSATSSQFSQWDSISWSPGASPWWWPTLVLWLALAVKRTDPWRDFWPGACWDRAEKSRWWMTWQRSHKSPFKVK